jgi:hypothetical protein
MSIPVNEALSMFVAVLMALALVSYLAYGRMAQAGLPPQRRRDVLVALWLLVCGLIALLLALRVASGGPALGGSPAAGGIWLGLEPRQVVALLTAIVLLIVGYARIRVVLQPLESGEPPVPPAAAENAESDQDT